MTALYLQSEPAVSGVALLVDVSALAHELLVVDVAAEAVHLDELPFLCAQLDDGRPVRIAGLVVNHAWQHMELNVLHILQVALTLLELQPFWLLFFLLFLILLLFLFLIFRLKRGVREGFLR